MRGFWRLTWTEFRIFLREPLGVLATVGIPLAAFLVLGRSLAPRLAQSPRAAEFAATGLPVFACLLISLSAATSLVAIISIYREGGILRRLKATPLSPVTILSAHVVLKLGLTVATLGLLVVAGRRFYPVPIEVDLAAFALALVLATLALLAVGFVVASAVPTARFAQPVASALLYSLLFVSGAAFPIAALPPVWRTAAQLSPVTHAYQLLAGVWAGEPLAAAALPAGALVVDMVICVALSARIFRWE